MFRLLTVAVLSLVASPAVLAQYPIANPNGNRNGYGGYATDPIGYPDRTGLGGPYSPSVARNGMGGFASTVNTANPPNRIGYGSFPRYPSGFGGSPMNRTELGGYPVISNRTGSSPRPVTYFSFSNPTPTATTGGYYVLPSR